MATYARARDWRGNVGGASVGDIFIGTHNLGSESGANFWSIGYMYNLSQRTNVSVGYARTRNEALVRYDMFANSSGNTAVGSDPRSFSVGLRHTF
jgi:predicted porin